MFKTNSVEHKIRKIMGDIYLWKQVFILITIIFFNISCGMMLSFPSVLNSALLPTNSTELEATANQISWIDISHGIAGIFGFCMLSPMLQIFGRKIVNITANLFMVIGWIIFALAQNVTALLTARIIQGFTFGAYFIAPMIVSEYVDSKRRGSFAVFKKCASAFGSLICHALPLVWNWRQIATLAIIFPTLSIVMTLFWPESPYYLAKKGHFKESEKSFIWLHGDSKLQELNDLHSSQLQKVENLNAEKWYTLILKKDFLKPFVIVCLTTLIVDLSGKFYFVIYVKQMMMELVDDKSLALYISIGTDVFAGIALMCSCLIISNFKRRIILFSFGAVIVGLMFIICFIITLKSTSVTWLAPTVIVLHSFIANFSIIPLCYTLIGEILPLEYKGWGSLLNGVVFTCMYTLLLKLTPVLMKIDGVRGVYLVYGISIAICLFGLYFILPETKDRTLQDIENEFKGVNLSNGIEVPVRS